MDWLAIPVVSSLCRYLPLFGSGQYDVVKEKDDDVPFEEQLRGLENAIKAGKVGCFFVARDALQSGTRNGKVTDVTEVIQYNPK